MIQQNALLQGQALGETYLDAKSAAKRLAEITKTKVTPVKRKLRSSGAKKMHLPYFRFFCYLVPDNRQSVFCVLRIEFVCKSFKLLLLRIDRVKIMLAYAKMTPGPRLPADLIALDQHSKRSKKMFNADDGFRGLSIALHLDFI